MSNVLFFVDTAIRNEVLQLIHDNIPACAKAAAQEVGSDGIKKFFEGYKYSIEEQKKAA